MKQEQEPEALVCAPADAPYMIAGSTFGRFCSKCNARVMLSPSGAQMLTKRPIPLICFICFRARFPRMAVRPWTEQQREELKTTVPNYWRERN